MVQSKNNISPVIEPMQSIPSPQPVKEKIEPTKPKASGMSEKQKTKDSGPQDSFKSALGDAQKAFDKALRKMPSKGTVKIK